MMLILKIKLTGELPVDDCAIFWIRNKCIFREVFDEVMLEETIPEIQRTNLTKVVLHLKKMEIRDVFRWYANKISHPCGNSNIWACLNQSIFCNFIIIMKLCLLLACYHYWLLIGCKNYYLTICCAWELVIF